MPSAGRLSLLHQPEQRRYVVHLLYATPLQRGRCQVIEDLVPLHDVPLRLTVPEEVTGAALAPQGDALELKRSGGSVAVTVPQVHLPPGGRVQLLIQPAGLSAFQPGARWMPPRRAPSSVIAAGWRSAVRCRHGFRAHAPSAGRSRPPRRRAPAQPVDTASGVQPPTAADFPGCKPVHLPRQELEDCEMRLEYWDSATETAWICDPTSSYHEGPTQRLGRLAERIAAVRGGPDGVLWPYRPDRARRARRAAPHHAGRRDGVPAPGARPAAAPGADDRRARLSGRGAGGGPHHRRAPGASCRSTRRGGSRRYGSRYRKHPHRAGRRAGGRG